MATDGYLVGIPFVPESRFAAGRIDPFQLVQNSAWHENAASEEQRAYAATVYMDGKPYRLGDVGVNIYWDHYPAKLSPFEIVTKYRHQRQAAHPAAGGSVQIVNLAAQALFLGAVMGIIGYGMRVSLFKKPVGPAYSYPALLWGIAAVFSAMTLCLFKSDQVLNKEYTSSNQVPSIWQLGAWRLRS